MELFETTQADIAVLLEAHGDSEEARQTADEVEQAILSAGSTSYGGANISTFGYGYESQVAGESHPYGMLVSRRPITPETIRLGDRREAVKVVIGDVAIYGVHLDHNSELARQVMARDLMADVAMAHGGVIVMGDFNATHKSGIVPGLVRGLRPLTDRIPQRFDGAISNSLRLLPGMHDGGTMALLNGGGLNDADPRHRPTVTPKRHDLPWPPALRMIQIDHILHSDNLTATDFRVHSDGGSDHRAVSATLTVR